MSGKAVEASGDVNTLLLDKTGTITLGNRQAVEFIPAEGVDSPNSRTPLSFRAWPTKPPKAAPSWCSPSRSSICGAVKSRSEAEFIPFSAYTRMSGVDLDGRRLRKGATEAITKFVSEQGGTVSPTFMKVSDRISRSGGTPLAVADGDGCWHRPPERHRQGRNEGTPGATARDGDPFGDDHR